MGIHEGGGGGANAEPWQHFNGYIWNYPGGGLETIMEGMFMIFHTIDGMGNLPPDYYSLVVESVMSLFDLKKNQSGQTKGSQRVETRT